MRKLFSAFVLAGTMALAGCAGVGATVTDFAVSISRPGPTQAKTIAEATLAATISEKALTVYVESANPSRAVLLELRALVPRVHAALKTAQDAQRRGDNAALAVALEAFNEALRALQAYQTAKGLPQ